MTRSRRDSNDSLDIERTESDPSDHEPASREALWDDRELLRRVQRVAQVGGWEIDLETGELSWTSEVYRIHEVPTDFEPDVETGIQFYAPEARSRLRNALDRCIHQGVPYDLELPFDTAEGNRRWVRARGEAVTDDNGTPVAVIGTIQDVTERREMRDQLREQRDLLQSINENVSEGIYRATREDGIVYANKAFAEMFGCERVEAVQSLDPTKLYADPRHRDEMWEAVEAIEQGSRELRLRRTDGSTFPARVSGTATRDDDGNIKYVDGVVTDLTEQRERKHRLQLFRKVVEQADEAVLITEAEPMDPPGPRIEYVNSAFTDITGYEPEEVLGETPRILQGPKTNRTTLRRIRKCVAEEERFEGETVNYRKDGTPYINHWTMTPVRDPDGTITHWASIQRDVTDQRLVWKKLLDVQNEERRRIDQEIHDEMSGRLASLQMMVDLARMNTENEEALIQLDEIEDLVQDLSSVARTISRQLHPQVLDEDGLPEALAYLKRHFREKHGVTVTREGTLQAEESLSSVVEETAFRGVQEALLNVAQHAETEEAQVHVSQGRNTLHLRVSDDGVGFDPSVPFEDDTCYGLEGVRKRAERLGGTLEIDSAPGKGTQIAITLPLHISRLPERELHRLTDAS